MPTFHARGARLDYVEHGEGAPVVLVHGSASDRRTWQAQIGNAVLGAGYYRRLSPSRLEQVRANAMKAEFLGSGFSPLDEHTHIMHEDNPAAHNAAVLAFLDGQAA